MLKAGYILMLGSPTGESSSVSLSKTLAQSPAVDIWKMGLSNSPGNLTGKPWPDSDVGRCSAFGVGNWWMSFTVWGPQGRD